MANYATLLAAIRAAIKANDQQAITGDVLQTVLTNIVGTLGTGYQFAGVATPTTNPGTPDGKVWYLAPAGSYPNFGATSAQPYVVPDGSLGVFRWDAAWSRQTVAIASVIPDVITYAECTTAAATAAKVVAAEGFKLVAGVQFRVKFTNANTAASPTLNIGGTGALPIMYGDAAASATNSWEAGEVVLVYYDGTSWQSCGAGGIKVIDNLTTGGTEDALSAQQGKVLGEAIFGVPGQEIVSPTMRQGVYNANDGRYASLNNRICTASGIKVSGEYMVSVGEGYRFNVLLFLDNGTFVRAISQTWLTEPFSGSWEGLIKINVAKTDDSALTPAAATGLEVVVTKSTSGILYNIDQLDTRLSTAEDNVARMDNAIDGYDDSPTMRQGVYDANYGRYASANNRICTASGIKVSGEYMVSVGEGYRFNVLLFLDNGTFVRAISQTWLTEPFSGSWAGLIKINVAKTDDSALTPAAATGLRLQTLGINDILYGYTLGHEVIDIDLEQGVINSDGSKNNDLISDRVRSSTFISVKGSFTIAMPSAFRVNVLFYQSSSYDTFEKSLGRWTQLPYTGEYDGYIMVNVKRSDESTIVPGDVDAKIAKTIWVAGQIDEVQELTSKTSVGGYMYGTDFLEKRVKVTQLGTLRYVQAFCIFGGRIYSTDGANIAEQDGEYTVVRDVVLPLGHGNALQLGHNGKAYASGWDDNKVYKVDLATLTIEETYTLPTSGYTTVAVDDIRGYMYIFQRQSYPNTIALYNYITYDYVNDVIISTRVLDEPFCAMQSCDYFEGKIAIVYGGGTVAEPSGMKIYNTAGDVVAVYDLDVFTRMEPEGIFFDRDNRRLLVSGVNKAVYVVTNV